LRNPFILSATARNEQEQSKDDCLAYVLILSNDRPSTARFAHPFTLSLSKGQGERTNKFCFFALTSRMKLQDSLSRTRVN